MALFAELLFIFEESICEFHGLPNTSVATSVRKTNPHFKTLYAVCR